MIAHVGKIGLSDFWTKDWNAVCIGIKCKGRVFEKNFDIGNWACSYCVWIWRGSKLIACMATFELSGFWCKDQNKKLLNRIVFCQCNSCDWDLDRINQASKLGEIWLQFRDKPILVALLESSECQVFSFRLRPWWSKWTLSCRRKVICNVKEVRYELCLSAFY